MATVNGMAAKVSKDGTVTSKRSGTTLGSITKVDGLWLARIYGKGGWITLGGLWRTRRAALDVITLGHCHEAVNGNI